MVRLLSFSLLTCLPLLACSPKAHEPAPASPAALAPSARAAPVSFAAPSRILEEGARYVDLVRTAGALDASTEPPGPACQLRQADGHYTLASELAAAVRPLPLPAEELNAALKSAGGVELLSAWGRYGDGDGSLALVSFSPHAPARKAVALLLTDRGVSLRSASGAGTLRHDELDVSSALAALAGHEDVLVFVAAEAAVSVAAIHDVLTGLSERGFAAALAVNLASGTTLPPPAAARVPRCSEGLPETSAPEGELDPSALARGLEPLKQLLPECLARGDAPGAAGGRVSVGFRINDSGRVQEACIRGGDIEDSGVLSCVIELAQRLSFVPPVPSGVVDIELPLALRPSSSSPPALVCE